MIDTILPLLVIIASLIALSMPLVMFYLNRSEKASQEVSDVLTQEDRDMINAIDNMTDEELVYLFKVMTMLYEVERSLKLPYYLEEIAVRRV